MRNVISTDVMPGVDLSSVLRPQGDHGRQGGGVRPPADGGAGARAAGLKVVLQHPVPACPARFRLMDPATAARASELHQSPAAHMLAV